MTSPAPWASALAQVGQLTTRLARSGIHLEMLDIGGGFPAQYDRAEPVPPPTDYGDVIATARSLDPLASVADGVSRVAPSASPGARSPDPPRPPQPARQRAQRPFQLELELVLVAVHLDLNPKLVGHAETQ